MPRLPKKTTISPESLVFGPCSSHICPLQSNAALPSRLGFSQISSFQLTAFRSFVSPHADRAERKTEPETLPQPGKDVLTAVWLDVVEAALGTEKMVGVSIKPWCIALLLNSARLPGRLHDSSFSYTPSITNPAKVLSRESADGRSEYQMVKGELFCKGSTIKDLLKEHPLGESPNPERSLHCNHIGYLQTEITL